MAIAMIATEFLAEARGEGEFKMQNAKCKMQKGALVYVENA
jgi:hypothetical protein